MATSTQVLGAARSHLGNVGGRFCKEPFGAPANAAWCAYFVSYVLRQAGVSDGPWTGWTPNLVTWAKKNGRWKTSGGKPGDIVMMMWANVSPAGRGNPPVCHTGFVEAVNKDGSYTTIEGNTSATVNGSQYNGNVCARRVRNSSVIKGFISMNLDGGSGTPAPSAPSEAEKIAQMNAGYSVDWIAAIQDKLNRLGYGPLQTDGVRGEHTRGAVKSFQVKNGLEPDSIPGPATNAKLDALLAPVATKVSISPLQAAVGAREDDVWGPDTDKRFDALRSASGHFGYKFPYGKAYAQGVVGVKQDGVWGPASRLAHDKVVRAVQRALGVTPDGFWGPVSEAAYLAIRARATKP